MTWHLPSAHGSAHLLHCCLANFVRVLTDALQEIFEVGHGNFLDLLMQFWNVVHHDLAKAIMAHLRQVQVLQVLQSLQGRVVSGREDQRSSEAGKITQFRSFPGDGGQLAKLWPSKTRNTRVPYSFYSSTDTQAYSPHPCVYQPTSGKTNCISAQGSFLGKGSG